MEGLNSEVYMVSSTIEAKNYSATQCKTSFIITFFS